MKFVKHVKSNVKQGVEAELSERTLIVGANGSGKTSIVQSLELVLTGTASDIEGRDLVKREGTLIKLTTDDELTVTATLNDAEEVCYRTEKTDSGAKRCERTKITASFPVREVRQALGGSADTARKWLLGRIEGDVKREDILGYLDPGVRELYTSLTNAYTDMNGTTEVDVFRSVIDHVKNTVRTTKAEAKQLEMEIRALSVSLGPEPNERTLLQAENRLQCAQKSYTTAQQKRMEYARAEAQKNLIGTLHQRAVSAIAEYERCGAAASRLKEALPPSTEPQAELSRLRKLIADVAQTHIEQSLDQCIACGGEGFVDWGGILSRMRRQEASEEAVETAYRRWKQATQREALALNRAEAAIASYKDAKAGTRPLPPEVTDTQLGVIEEGVAEARDGYNRLNQAVRSWLSVRSKQDALGGKRRKVIEYDALMGAMGFVEGSILERAKLDFCSLVNEYLPDQDTFEIELTTETGKGICRVGLMRDGVLHTALSGAEWARMTLAMACAASGPANGAIKVFTPEERAFDPSTLAKVMEALSSAPGQVVLTSPIPPDRVPSGWSVIELAGTTP